MRNILSFLMLIGVVLWGVQCEKEGEPVTSKINKIIEGTRGPVVVIIKSSDLRAYNEPIAEFKKLIQARFYIYNIKGDEAFVRATAQDIYNLKPKLIYALGARAAIACRTHIPYIPTIFSVVLNYEKYDLKRSNITGITLELPVETIISQFKMVLPSVKTIGVIYNPNNSNYLITQTQKSMKELGINFIYKQIQNSADVQRAFFAIANQIQTLWLLPDPDVVTVENFRFFVKEATKRKLPLMAFSEYFVKAGALFSISPDYGAIGKQAAEIANKILAGTYPSTIPISPPSKSYLVINRDVLNLMGIKLDPMVNDFVDKFIEKPTPSNQNK